MKLENGEKKEKEGERRKDKGTIKVQKIEHTLGIVLKSTI